MARRTWMIVGGAVVVVVALALGVTVAVTTAAQARPRDGYTLRLPDLDPLATPAGPTRLLTGVHQHAGYVVEVPPAWNGELVAWAHGFQGNGPELRVDAPFYGLRERFVGQGYAWAASSYDRNGYDVASGVRSTRALVDRFADLVGEPSRTYLAGVSMGGHITARSLEEYPAVYAGGLPLCGALSGVELFDYFLDVEVTAEAIAGVRAYPPGPDYATAALPGVYAGLGLTPGDGTVRTPGAAQFRDAVVLDSGGPRPGTEGAFGYWADFLLEFAVPETGPTPVEGLAADPGRVATNEGTDYAPDAPILLDGLVQRVAAADPAARSDPALTAVAPLAGTPQVPVLSLHGLGDLFVPFSAEQSYARAVAANGIADRLVQRAIRTAGHCEFSAAEAGAAWDDLVAWVETGARPGGDDVLDPATVADPAYGCRFSDAAAYAAAGPVADDATRPLYDPCPN